MFQIRSVLPTFAFSLLHYGVAPMALLLFVLALCLPWPLRAAPFPYALQWKRLVPGIVGGALVQCDSLVFVGTTDGRVLAVDRADGVRRWQRRGYAPVHKGLVLVDGASAFVDAWGGRADPR